MSINVRDNKHDKQAEVNAGASCFFIRPSSDGTYYGMVMSVRPSVRVSVRPSVRPSRPSVRPSVRHSFSALFSYMLWHIDLKFCVSLYFYARKIKFECHQFPSLFAGVMLLFNFKLLQICSFSALFSYMLWHIEFKFCIWLCYNVPQSKFECRHFASIFVGVMPLCELRILEIHSFPLFFSSMLWHIELKFCIWLCFTVLQIKFECLQFPSIFVGVMPLLELRILEIHSFRTFLLHPLTYWAESLHITLFFCTTDQVWVSSICVYFGVMPLFELRIL